MHLTAENISHIDAQVRCQLTNSVTVVFLLIYKLCNTIKAPDGLSGENDEFRCGVCMVKEMMKLKREIEENGMYEEY